MITAPQSPVGRVGQYGGEPFVWPLDRHEQDVALRGGVDKSADQRGGDRSVAEAASIGVPPVDGREQVGQGVEGRVDRTADGAVDADRGQMGRVLRIGRRCTVVRRPRCASATTRWCSAAPQLMSRSRRCGSVAVRCRLRSAYSSTVPSAPSMRHCHGCVLCTEGPARRAGRPRRAARWRSSLVPSLGVRGLWDRGVVHPAPMGWPGRTGNRNAGRGASRTAQGACRKAEAATRPR